MLKKRIIPLLLWQQGKLVKSRQFRNNRVVGDLVKTCKVYSDQDADEIMILNIDQEISRTAVFLESIEELSRNIMMPVSVGGGIKSIWDAEAAFRAGADKIVLNSVLYSEASLLKQLSSSFGAQSIVASIDFLSTENGVRLFSKNGQKAEDTSLSDHLSRLEDSGCGEILIQSISHDGMRNGYELDILRTVVDRTRVPIIVAGGAGNFSHLLDAFMTSADAVACGTLFNFGDNNPLRAKAFLRNHGVSLKKAL